MAGNQVMHKKLSFFFLESLSKDARFGIHKEAKAYVEAHSPGGNAFAMMEPPADKKAKSAKLGRAKAVLARHIEENLLEPECGMCSMYVKPPEGRTVLLCKWNEHGGWKVFDEQLLKHSNNELSGASFLAEMR